MGSDLIRTGQVIAQRYRIERQLGRGGMGSVFLVTHLHTDEHLALKILHSAVISDAVALERFRREARTPARIQSDHVVRVTDADVAEELGDAPFLVMEYLRGEDLEQRSARLGPLQPEEVVVYLRHAARALDKAHTIGIVHRDLKPENLFLTTREDGTPCVKILDFGIAKLTGEASRQLSRAAATSTGQVFGTPLYMAPEQAKGEAAKISPQTDIWSLGLIAHRLLTGTEIWTAETITHLIAQIAYEPMPVPSEHGADFGPAYDEWFAVCCARDVQQRHETAGEAIRALGRALEIEDSHIGLVPVGPRIDEGTGRFQIAAPSSDPAVSTMKAADLMAIQSAATLALMPSSPSASASSPSSAPSPSNRVSPASTPLKSSSGALTRSADLGDAVARRVRWLSIAAVLGLGAAALLVGAVWWSTTGVPPPAGDVPASSDSSAILLPPPLPPLPVPAPTPEITTTPALTPPPSVPSAVRSPAPPVRTGAGISPPNKAPAAPGASPPNKAPAAPGASPPNKAPEAPSASPPNKAPAAPSTSAPSAKASAGIPPPSGPFGAASATAPPIKAPAPPTPKKQPLADPMIGRQ